MACSTRFSRFISSAWLDWAKRASDDALATSGLLRCNRGHFMSCPDARSSLIEASGCSLTRPVTQFSILFCWHVELVGRAGVRGRLCLYCNFHPCRKLAVRGRAPATQQTRLLHQCVTVMKEVRCI